MKKNFKQATAGLLMFVMVFTAIFGTGAMEVRAASYGLVNNEVVYFGNYIQEDTNGDGTVDGWDDPQPIKWRVLQGSTSGAWMLLVSDKILDARQYHYEKVSGLKWAESDLRQWLNDEFYNEAFTKAEQQRFYDFEYSYIKTVNGEDIETKYTDKVSVLSRINMEYTYSSSFKNYDARRAEPTGYAAQRGWHWDVGDGYSDLRMVYWLETSFSSGFADTCNGSFGSGSVTSYNGVRPVIQVKNSIASGGGTSGGSTSSGSTSTGTISGGTSSGNTSTGTASGTNSNTTGGTVLGGSTDLLSQLQQLLEEIQATISSKIKSLKVTNKKKGKTVVTFKKVSKSTGYEIQYARNKKFTKGEVCKTTEKTSYTIRNLSKKKTYYFRVRAYKKINGTTYYGNWSSVKSLKVKR